MKKDLRYKHKPELVKKVRDLYNSGSGIGVTQISRDLNLPLATVKSYAYGKARLEVQ